MPVKTKTVPYQPRMCACLSDTFDHDSKLLYDAACGDTSPEQVTDVGAQQVTISRSLETYAEERVVVVGDEMRKRGTPLLREVPGSISEVASVEQMRRYSIDALRRLAKNEGVELCKNMQRDGIIKELLETYSSTTEVTNTAVA